MTAPIPQNEKKRLKVLWQYEVLDTVPEEVFDDLTELAARICEAPIALISLVDEKRQWFKSKVGTSVNETSREVSFCAHAINQTELFIVPDATQDTRFAQNPLVTSDPKIRFYAGAPLITPDGQALRILAHHVVSQLELRRRTKQLRDVRAESARLQNDLDKARAALAAARRELAGRHPAPWPSPAPKPGRNEGKPQGKMVEPTGIEPATFSLRTRRSTN